MNIDELKALAQQAEDALLKFQDVQGAEQLSITLLEITPKDDPSLTEVRCTALIVLASALGRQRKMKEAEPYVAEAKALTAQAGLWRLHAKLYGNMGSAHRALSEFSQAIQQTEVAVQICLEHDLQSVAARHLSNLGAVYVQSGDNVRGLEHLTRALAILERDEDTRSIAVTRNAIGNVYGSLGLHDKAIEIHASALPLITQLGDAGLEAQCLNHLGVSNYYAGNLDEAMHYYMRSMPILHSLNLHSGIATCFCNIGLIHKDRAEYEEALDWYHRALSENSHVGVPVDSGAFLLGSIGELYAEENFVGRDVQQAEEYLLKALSILERGGNKSARFRFSRILSRLYSTTLRWEEAYRYLALHLQLKDEVRDSESFKKAQGYEIEKAAEIERARSSSERKILNNILPEEVTARLINGENPIADSFEEVSILFMDIVDFTRLAASVQARQLVFLLNAIFSAADAVMREFGLEKIKTIGDAYMAVAGAPTVQHDHALRAAKAALRLLDVVTNLVVRIPEDYGERSWIESIPEINVRIGLHCGPVAAGVVGENKFSYDLWGDAVNTAARMESHGVVGKIHVSADFATCLRQQFDASGVDLNFFELPERGQIDVKGKGLMQTYLLERA